jgi:hypothetical protein
LPTLLCRTERAIDCPAHFYWRPLASGDDDAGHQFAELIRPI